MSNENDAALRLQIKIASLEAEISKLRSELNPPKFSDLSGKTIANAMQMKHPSCDDSGWLRLAFTDGSAFDIEACYGGYSGESVDEYPTLIFLKHADPALVPA